jgi:hypothetical protein
VTIRRLGMRATAFEPLAGSLQDRRATGYRELGLSGDPKGRDTM